MPILPRFFQQSELKKHRGWMFSIPSILILGLLAIPVISLVGRASQGGFIRYALSDSALTALRLSLLTSLLSVAVSIALGTPLAYILARWKFPFKSWVELFIDLPVILPPSVAGLALLIAFGRQGLIGGFLSRVGINLPFTTAAVVIAQTFVAAPLYIRAARLGFASIEVQLEEAAHVEGASQWQLFREVMVPLTGRSLLNGAILTWTRALGEFGATILFAGNLEGVTQTMPLAIYLGFESNLGVAVALSVMLVIVSVVLIAATRRLEKDIHQE